MPRDRILWLNDEQVAALLPPSAALASVEHALKLHALGHFQQPLKPYLRPGNRENDYNQGRLIVMPACLGGELDIMGTKIIAGFPANVDRGLPRASGLVVLNSTQTGFPLAVMECGELSARRTAAVARLCVRELAGPGPHRVSIFGCGPIAGAVLDSLAEQPAIERCVLYDPRHERSQELAAQKSARLSIPVAAAPDMETALRDTSVLVLATTGGRDYLTPDLAGRTKLIVSLSLDDPTDDLFLTSKILVDSFDDSNREQKLLARLVQRGLFSHDRVHAELGEILLGRKPGRQRPDERILANLMGMAVEDIACAFTVYLAALERNVGSFLN